MRQRLDLVCIGSGAVPQVFSQPILGRSAKRFNCRLFRKGRNNPAVDPTRTCNSLSHMKKTIWRFVTWNCNMALRKKWSFLAELHPDIAIVPECEDPVRTEDRRYRGWAANHLWVGSNKDKGLGVFYFEGIVVNCIEFDFHELGFFLPCKINDSWPLIAVWTKRKPSETRYIRQIWTLLQRHPALFDHPLAMAIGDFNSNTIWDRKHPGKSHSNVVRQLRELGLESCYHRHFAEDHGEETLKTQFMYRKRKNSYHIDYVFAGHGWQIRNVEIGDPDRWLLLSDHLPIIVDLSFSDVERLESGRQ